MYDHSWILKSICKDLSKKYKNVFCEEIKMEEDTKEKEQLV